MKSGLNCFTISPGQPFMAVLADWIIERFGSDMAVLSQLLVLLPTRRACRSLREAFLEATGGKPTLLPRIQPIGDLDEETIFYHNFTGGSIPPAIAPMRRQLLLTRLVLTFGHKQYGTEQAVDLARRLARFIDDVAREDLRFEGLSKLVPQELAVHWQETLDFLKLVSHHWPQILENEGSIDPAQRRNLELAAIAQAWRTQPPPYPVIAAGSTGSIPATAALLKTIARLLQGMVVLPGLDCAMPDGEWDMVGETHPQYGLKKLLESMECRRDDVKPLAAQDTTRSQERLACLRAILQPPEATSHWMQATLPQNGLEGIRLLTADTLLDEARMIAVILRETLDTPGKTAALVTPDRQLARMVAAQMQRFSIAIDDSAGRPLADTPPGCFLRLVAEMVAAQAAPAPLLALLRHPLAACGMEPARCRQLSRLLETGLLRGIRHAPGLETLCAAATAAGHKELLFLLQGLATHVRPLAECFEKKETSLVQMLAAHVQCAEWLASTAAQHGAERLWAGQAGNVLAAFLAELSGHAGLMESIDPMAYPGLFNALLAEQVYRPSFGLHPRLHILSPLEARLQHFDRVVLGSLNEGTWPQLAEADPWMSRPMRASFGLPAAERAIGQSAHDVSMLCAAPEVILSRARKVDGTPTMPSRWLVRLSILVSGLNKGYCEHMKVESHYGRGIRLIDAPLSLPVLPKAAPKPPLSARPRQLSVTVIDNWLRDPYMVYARYILRLNKLEPLDEEPDAADFGQLVHKALEQFIQAYPKALPENACKVLLQYGRDAFAGFMDRPAVQCLWWPRFEAMAGWLVKQERERRTALVQVAAELRGHWNFLVNGKAFTLTTRIDRIDIRREGTVIIDYKTGRVPTKSDIEQGLANQLPLEALVAMHGTLEPKNQLTDIIGLEYWKLAGNPEDCEIRTMDIQEIAMAQLRLEQLITRFDQPDTPYAAQGNPSLQSRYNDYEHLTRWPEWETA